MGKKNSTCLVSSSERADLREILHKCQVVPKMEAASFALAVQPLGFQAVM